MTNEEAISILRVAEEDMRCGNIPIIPIETYGIAIKAIEKQIPKPKHKYMGYRCVCGNLHLYLREL